MQLSPNPNTKLEYVASKPALASHQPPMYLGDVFGGVFRDVFAVVLGDVCAGMSLRVFLGMSGWLFQGISLEDGGLGTHSGGCLLYAF